MPSRCRACGAHVTDRFVRVYGDQDNPAAWACPECTGWTAISNGAATGEEADGTYTTSVTYDAETGEFSLQAAPRQAVLHEETASESEAPDAFDRTDPVGERYDRVPSTVQTPAEEHNIDDPEFAKLLG